MHQHLGERMCETSRTLAALSAMHLHGASAGSARFLESVDLLARPPASPVLAARQYLLERYLECYAPASLLPRGVARLAILRLHDGRELHIPDA